MRDLIERLKNGNTPELKYSATLLEEWYELYSLSGAYIYYDDIYGFLFGLYATGFISDEERYKITKKLLIN